MNKSDELKNPISCLNKASPNEPIFVLRANDLIAPQTIKLWAAMAHGEHEELKIQAALDLAESMENYQMQNLIQEDVSYSKGDKNETK